MTVRLGDYMVAYHELYAEQNGRFSENVSFAIAIHLRTLVFS